MSDKLSLPLMLLLFCATVFGQVPRPTEFISYGEAQPIIGGMRGSLPPELEALGAIDAGKWNAWVQERDREIRQRLDRGEEDTLVNLLRFGVTYTKEYRIEDEYLVRYGNSSLVDSFAQNRADDLVRALAAPNPSPGLTDMRDFLVKQGFSFKTPQERVKVKKYLLDTLARMRDEFLKYRAQKKDESRFQLFQDRGISLDTNLWPDYQLDVAFRELAAKGLMKPGSVRRVAIVGCVPDRITIPSASASARRSAATSCTSFVSTTTSIPGSARSCANPSSASLSVTSTRCATIKDSHSPQVLI